MKYSRRFLRKYFFRRISLQDKGSISIAFTFFMILIFLILGLVSNSVLRVESLNSVNFTQAMQAQYLAEAGIEYGIKRIFQGESAPYSESVAISGGTFNMEIMEIADLGRVLQLTSTGGAGDAEKTIQVLVYYPPPIGDFGIYATGDVTDVTTLDENGDPDPSLLVANAPYLPDIDNQALIDMATSQGHVETGPAFDPAHGYPNFNFYFNGSTPNVTYVQGDLHVHGGRTVYGIFMVAGNIILDGSARVKGVLYMITPNTVVIHGGGNPTESSVTGGVVANGEVRGTGNHITVYYNSEYMGIFESFENREAAFEIISWREP